MIDFNEIPRNPDNALMYLSDYLTNIHLDCFDSDNDITPHGYGELSGLAKLIEVSSSKSSFENADAFKNIATLMLNVLDSNNGIYKHQAAIYAVKIANEVLQARLTKRLLVSEVEPLFVLEKEETSKITALSAEMRGIVTASVVFDKNHKRRMLHRISAIEQEVQKSEGRFDVILAGISDFGDTLKKFGEDAKPLVDIMRKIRCISQKKTDDYRGLPAPEEIKNLPAPDKVSAATMNGGASS